MGLVSDGVNLGSKKRDFRLGVLPFTGMVRALADYWNSDYVKGVISGMYPSQKVKVTERELKGLRVWLDEDDDLNVSILRTAYLPHEEREFKVRLQVLLSFDVDPALYPYMRGSKVSLASFAVRENANGTPSLQPMGYLMKVEDMVKPLMTQVLVSLKKVRKEFGFVGDLNCVKSSGLVDTYGLVPSGTLSVIFSPKGGIRKETHKSIVDLGVKARATIWDYQKSLKDKNKVITLKPSVAVPEEDVVVVASNKVAVIEGEVPKLVKPNPSEEALTGDLSKVSQKTGKTTKVEENSLKLEENGVKTPITREGFLEGTSDNPVQAIGTVEPVAVEAVEVPDGYVLAHGVAVSKEVIAKRKQNKLLKPVLRKPINVFYSKELQPMNMATTKRNLPEIGVLGARYMTEYSRVVPMLRRSRVSEASV